MSQLYTAVDNWSITSVYDQKTSTIFGVAMTQNAMYESPVRELRLKRFWFFSKQNPDRDS